jgi:hypothetical protein
MLRSKERVQVVISLQNKRGDWREKRGGGEKVQNRWREIFFISPSRHSARPTVFSLLLRPISLARAGSAPAGPPTVLPAPPTPAVSAASPARTVT